MRVFAVAAALSALALLASREAPAGLAEWQVAVAADTPAVFTDTSIAAPTTRDIGALPADRTYEFIVTSSVIVCSRMILTPVCSTLW